MKLQFSRRFAVFGILTILWMMVIFVFSSQDGSHSSGLSARLVKLLCVMVRYNPPPDVFSSLTFIARKVAHMTEFGILALLWLGTLTGCAKDFAWRYPAAFALSSLYAVTDEFHQLFVSGRAGQAADWLIDSSGALIFLLTAWILSKILLKRMMS